MNWQGGREEAQIIRRRARAGPLALWLLFLLAVTPARAALQFDVFLGYDDLIREANWFPVACEIHNDGASFNGVVEITSDQFGRGQVRRVVLELPTNTRKRFVIPVFGSAGRYGAWNVRLLDERGKVRAEKLSLRPRREVSWRAKVLGALPRTFGGLPKMPDRSGVNRGDLEPEVARLQADYFPDNPIALEGLDALYLHAEKALDLNVAQANAVVSWVAGGGHLIVGVEQPTEVNATPWLRSLLPGELTGMTTVKDFAPLEGWAKELSEEAAKVQPNQPRPPSKSGDMRQPSPSITALEPQPPSSEMPAVTCSIRDGRAVLTSAGLPLVIEAVRGRGKVTLLAFSPEREPFRSWKNKGWFWAKLLDAPPEALSSQNFPNYTYQSLDSVFGAMIDSKQIRKLPVSWLLLLLVVYLLVIGPVDQYSLKKLNKQMLTWITFPSYVVGFSLLIYWIGFLLRAGETEWNELHVVDVIPRGQRTELRGRTYGSVYSPSNARYQFALAGGEGSRKFATMRGEFLGNWGGGQDTSRGSVEQRGDGFAADVFVPVWTSQLTVSDWLQGGEAPVQATVRRRGNGYVAIIENKLTRPLKEVRVVVENRVFAVGEVEAGASKNFEIISTASGTRLPDFVRQHAGQFGYAVQQRRQAFGSSEQQRIANPPLATMAASFTTTLNEGANPQHYNYNENFTMPRGMDLADVAQSGQAVLLAWDEGKSLVAPLNQFTPRRQSTQTLLRLAVPVEAGN
jgi:hypothetical protein